MNHEDKKEVKNDPEALASGEIESDRLKKAERALRAQIIGFRAGDRLSRDQMHERTA